MREELVARIEPVCAPEKTSVEVPRMRRVQRAAAVEVFNIRIIALGHHGIHLQRNTIRLTVFQPGLAPQNLALPRGVRSRSAAPPMHGADQGPLPLAPPRRDRLRRGDAGSCATAAASTARCSTACASTAPTPLRPGDRIGLGDSEVVFHVRRHDLAAHRRRQRLAREEPRHLRSTTTSSGSERTNDPRVAGGAVHRRPPDERAVRLHPRPRHGAAAAVARRHRAPRPGRQDIRQRPPAPQERRTTRRICASAARCCSEVVEGAQRRVVRRHARGRQASRERATRSSPSRSAPRSARRSWSATRSSACSISTSSANRGAVTHERRAPDRADRALRGGQARDDAPARGGDGQGEDRRGAAHRVHDPEPAAAGARCPTSTATSSPARTGRAGRSAATTTTWWCVPTAASTSSSPT